MVLYSAGKMARNAASICNRTNTCGGNKKAGTAPRVGFFMQNNPTLMRAPQTVPRTCVISTTIQTQKYGYRATHGGNMG
uniref:Uncharacterized protein n=1 Tax=viral metagenome TaxID=1070528 RepID=A0A6C0ES65_9ZZZZ